jgi:hypothetical protein
MRRKSHEDLRNASKIVAGKHERKIPLERPKSRWEENIKVDFKEMLCDKVDWIHLAQDRIQRRTFVDRCFFFMKVGLFLHRLSYYKLVSSFVCLTTVIWRR